MLDLADSIQSSARSVSGRWQVVRLCLDLATQEWLNAGVMFTGADGRPHLRLLSNLSGMKCLYDEDAADTASFLLDQAQHALESGAALPPGWNVALGPEQFVRGDSVAAITTDLFARMVPLARHEAEMLERVDREGHQHATRNVRAAVRVLISNHLQIAKRGYPDFWPRGPLKVTRDGATVSMDVQVAGTTSQGRLYGAVASAWYKTHYHRNASLSQAVQAVTTAREVYPKDASVLYLLQPPRATDTLSEADHRDIAEEVESARWLLKKNDAELRVAGSEYQMANAILEDLQLATLVH